MFLPERKNSRALVPALFAVYRPIINEIRKKEPIKIQSRVERIIKSWVRNLK